MSPENENLTGRLVNGEPQEDDQALESLRPKSLAEFVGQEEAKANLSVFITATKQRGEALDHVLLHGHPGLGKTTLAQILASELDVGITRHPAGRSWRGAGDLAAILTNLSPRDVLFVDEIHRLNHVVEEVLYPAMEDFHLDLVIGQGPSARTVKLDLPPFTLVGATTRTGLLTPPLRDRFGVQIRVDFYTPKQLAQIVTRSARILGLEMDQDGAGRDRPGGPGPPQGWPTACSKGVRDFAQVEADGKVDKKLADYALTRLGVDRNRPGPRGPRACLHHNPEIRRRARGA